MNLLMDALQINRSIAHHLISQFLSSIKQLIYKGKGTSRSLIGFNHTSDKQTRTTARRVSDLLIKSTITEDTGRHKIVISNV